MIIKTEFKEQPKPINISEAAQSDFMKLISDMCGPGKTNTSRVAIRDQFEKQVIAAIEAKLIITEPTSAEYALMYIGFLEEKLATAEQDNADLVEQINTLSKSKSKEEINNETST